MSPEVQNWGISGPTKSTDVLHIFFDKKRKKSLDVSGCMLVLTKISSGTSKKFESFSNFTTMNCCDYILYQSEQSSVFVFRDFKEYVITNKCKQHWDLLPTGMLISRWYSNRMRTTRPSPYGGVSVQRSLPDRDPPGQRPPHPRNMGPGTESPLP